MSVPSSVSFPAFTFREILASNSTATSAGGPVPAACQQTCAPIVPFALEGQNCTPSPCCTSQWEQQYYSCILCASQAQQIYDLSNAQHTLDEIYTDCAGAGKPIPLLTFPGQSLNRTLPSPTSVASISGTTTVSTSSSTAPSTPSHSSASSPNKIFVSSTQRRWAILVAPLTIRAVVSFLL